MSADTAANRRRSTTWLDHRARPRLVRLGLATALVVGISCVAQAAAEENQGKGGAATTQTGLTVVARITARPGDAAKLLAALRDDERQTIAKEPGCLSFEVLTRDGHPNEFVLYESYRDEGAFKVHKSEPHFAAFETAVKRFGAGAPVIKLFKQAG